MRITHKIGLFGLFACFSSFAADTYTWGNVRLEGGGFVSGISTHKAVKDLIYIRTDVGGAYRWEPTSSTWIPLMDWLDEDHGSVFGTEGLALDPNRPTRLYLYGGIEYFNKGKTMILRSDDYGQTFDTIDVTSKFKAHGNGMGRNAGEKLVVDPKNGGILYCGSRMNGLWRSTDSAKTWNQVAGTATTAGGSLANDVGITYIVFDENSGTANGGTKTLYMGVGKNSSPLFKSTDGGNSFSPVAGAPALMPLRAVVVNGTLYSTFSNGPGPHGTSGGSVWKYDGTTWTNITPKRPDGTTRYGDGTTEGYGYSWGGLTVDPKDPQHLIVCTLALYLGATNWPDGKKNASELFFETKDGGATWRTLNPQTLTEVNMDPNGNNWVTGGNVHWSGAMEFDPFDSKKVWVVSGNGVFRTDDVSKTVPVWKFVSKGIEETVPFEAISIPGGPLVTAIGDYDGATYDDITASVPTHDHSVGSVNSLGYGEAAQAFVRSNRVTDYSTGKGITFDAIYRSMDAGRTWTLFDTSKVPGSGGKLALSANGKSVLINPGNVRNGSGANTSSYWRSSDDGQTWAAVKGLPNADGRIVSDPVNAAKFYVMPSGYQGDFYASNDSGKTFAVVGSLNNPQAPHSQGMLRAAPGVEGDLWIGLDEVQPWTSTGYSSDGLAHSTDGGKTWEFIKTMDGCITMGLGKAKDASSYYALYMWGAANGGKRGIYRSTDKGQTWLRINDDAHQYGGPGNGKFVVGDFNVYGRVYMSTAGRGIVYGNIGPVSSATHPKANGSARLINVGLEQHGQNLVIQSVGLHNSQLELYDYSGRQVLVKQFNSGRQEISLATLGKGAYVARVTADEGNMLGRRIVVE